MADVFISYSKVDRQLVEQLAHELLAKGFTVWWDTELVSGESFRDVIVRQLKEARAVIVVWTPSSVKSEWVISEADRGRYRGILIPVRTDDLAVQEIPPPFDVPIVYTDGRRAILAVEKGTPGERAFKEAFAAWGE